jgi:hypothetical protein
VDIPEAEYEQMFATESFVGQDEGDALSSLAKLVDGASERRSVEGLRKAVRLGGELLSQDLSPKGKTTGHYCVSNAWASLYEIEHRNTDRTWDWTLPELEGQLRHLRLAANSLGFKEVVAGRRTQIHTNTANLLSQLGRSCDAVAAYDEALSDFPGFSMALGNRGIALVHLAIAHYDQGQGYVILHNANRSLKDALEDPQQLEPGAAEGFVSWRKWIEANIPAEFLERPTPLNTEYSLGRSKGERAYREWCLANTLFLNPMNDCGELSVAATDTVNMPSHVLGIGEGPGFFGLFNQIKQEYVGARLLFWEGIAASKTPFADRDVLLMDTLDYPVYGLAVEKQRIAFRMAYSLLDKLAFLLNKYFSLGISDNIVNLNRVWFTDGDPKKGLSVDLVDRENWPLRGLFWLARDLFDERGLQDAVDPEARTLRDIRNHLEHKYLKLHDSFWAEPAGGRSNGLQDQLSHSIRQEDFQAKTLRLLSLTRCAIVYCALAIHREEMLRARHRGPDAITPPMILPTTDGYR